MEKALQLPQNYVELEQEEMMYLDGGFGIPNWTVAVAINAGVNLVINKFTGGGAFALIASLKSAGKTRIVRKLTAGIGRFMSTQAANRIAGTVANFLFGGIGISSVGNVVARNLDARDRRPNNGWVDF